MNLIESLIRRPARAAEPVRHMDWINIAGGLSAPLFGLQQTLQSDRESIENNFTGYVQGAYKSNGVVFACELTRMALFSEARIMFQRLRNGRPGDLFGSTDLRVFERPWRNATTSDLLVRAITDADLAGNFYAVRRGDRIRRLRPDWVSVLIGVPEDIGVAAPLDGVDWEVVGYEYQHGGPLAQSEPVRFSAEEVMHFAPIPDPEAAFRGMSWLSPVLRDIESDSQATVHKQNFFANGATPNMVVKLDVSDEERFKSWVRVLEENHAGAANAYKTLYLAAGSDATVVGANMQQLDFRAVQSYGENRIVEAAGLHGAVVGTSESMGGSSLNAGNFTAARRLVGDKTLRPLWRSFCGSAEPMVQVPEDARLWYDDRDIPFLRDDATDEAEIHNKNAITIRQLVDGGYDPDSVRDAVVSGDFSLLVHTGLPPVQVQSPTA